MTGAKALGHISPGAKTAEVFQAHDATQEAYTVAGLDRHAVPDTACRRSLIGERVLKRLEAHVRAAGLYVARRPRVTMFQFRSAGTVKSVEDAAIPCVIGNRKVAFQVAVLPVPGAETPFLMSKELLR